MMSTSQTYAILLRLSVYMLAEGRDEKKNSIQILYSKQANYSTYTCLFMNFKCICTLQYYTTYMICGSGEPPREEQTKSMG